MLKFKKLMFNQYLEIGWRLQPKFKNWFFSQNMDQRSLRSKFKHLKVFLLWLLNTDKADKLVKKTQLHLVFSICLTVYILFRNEKNTYSSLNYYIKHCHSVTVKWQWSDYAVEILCPFNCQFYKRCYDEIYIETAPFIGRDVFTQLFYYIRS